jgi:hypothetical protein
MLEIGSTSRPRIKPAEESSGQPTNFTRGVEIQTAEIT